MSVNYSAPLEPGRFYHIFNRGNNKENIFFKQDNYQYFLVKFDEYLSVYLDVYVFCLLVNHFHFLVRVKVNLPGFENLEGLRCPIVQAFSNFFNAYSKAINKQENRSGSLSQKQFKRILIDNEAYLLHLIYYIHKNPIHHNVCKNIKNYKWGSYNRILDNRPSKLMKQAVINLFGNKLHYIEFHQRKEIDYKECEKYLIDD